MTVDLRDRTLALFDPEVATNLVRFAEHIATIDADYLIFVARKSLRLYDMLVQLGLRPANHIVLSDRVLDISPSALKGKRLALIDDSLILGTSLAKIENRIRASITPHVSSHVFCINTEWSNPDIFRPDFALMELDDRQTMTFCATEVKALAALGIPYLVDFPFSTPVCVQLSQFEKLFGSFDWEVHALSTPLQEQWGTYLYSFLPSSDLLGQFASSLGRSLFDIIDIIKIRAFANARNSRTSTINITFVPIVTIKPMYVSSVDKLFSNFAERLSNLASTTAFADSFYTPVAKARFIQYMLSIAIGDYFLQTTSHVLQPKRPISFDENEAARHFGPWLLDSIRVLHRYSRSVVFSEAEFDGVGCLKAVPTSPGIVSTINDVIDASPKALASKRNAREVGGSPSNILTDFSELFLDLYDKHEIPARGEAKKFGKKVLDPEFRDARHRNRLEIGLPWSQIVAYLADLYHLKNKPDVSNIISLLMDVWHDMGIAVPIFAVQDDIVFRAYRHGEDVKITNQELALIHELASGYIEGAKRSSVPRLVMEKMLVCWARLGLAKDWLTPTWGPTGADGVARIGFYLKGAILFHPRRSDSILAGEKGTWLSSYCLYRGVLRHNETGQFVLGRSVDANFERAWAPHESRKVGRLFGLLTRAGAPLADDERKRIVLSTCVSPRDVAGAIEAELQVLHDWCDRSLQALQNSTRLNDRSSLKDTLRKLRASHATEAVFSARMKYLGYVRGEPRSIVDECYEFISADNEFAADEWRALWSSVLDRSYRLDEKRVLDAIQSAMSTIFVFGICLLLLELVLLVAIADTSRRPRRFTKPFLAKLEGFFSDFRVRLRFNNESERLIGRIDKLRADTDFSTFDPATVWNFAFARLRKLLIEVVTDKEHLYMLNSQSRLDNAQRYYSHMLWYDIIGSTGERFGLSGSEKAEHEKKVGEFKAAVSRALEETSEYIAVNRGEMFAWNGTVESHNDEKHLFISGPDNRQIEFVDLILHTIIRETRRFDRIKVRLVVFPCSFAGSKVWRFEKATEVIGERFWMHSARVKEQLKKKEMADFNLGRNILYLCTEDLASRSQVSLFCGLHNQVTYEIITNPDAVALTTPVTSWNAT
jgi:hypothetical protein